MSGLALEALQAARHELTTLQGLVATDRPDLWDREMAWVIDSLATLALIDRALSEFSESGTEVP